MKRLALSARSRLEAPWQSFERGPRCPECISFWTLNYRYAATRPSHTVRVSASIQRTFGIRSSAIESDPDSTSNSRTPTKLSHDTIPLTGDWRREKERLRQRRRRERQRTDKLVAKQSLAGIAHSILPPQEPEPTKQPRFHRPVPPFSMANHPTNHGNDQTITQRPTDPSSSDSALTDPAVNAILDDLKRLTEQLSFPETTSSKSLSADHNSHTFVGDTTSRSAQIRARRVVSQFIPMWLRREPTWKVAVLQHLQLPAHLDTNQSRVSSGTATLPGQNFYPDSIPSFVEVLKQGPPESLYEALDHLVEAGLADAGVAEKYRATNRLRVQQQDVAAALAEQKLVLERHETLYQQQSVDLADIEARIQALQQSSPRQGKRKSNEDAASFDKQMANLEKIKREKTQQTARQRDQMDSIRAKVKAWRTHQPEPPLTEEEYRRIQTAATTAMPSITLAFANHVRDRHSQLLEQYQALDAQTDLTRPHDWFIHARLDRRRIVFHGGPTNSGKTFAALERLKQASKGLYLGPLRLLAVEIYEKLTADGIYCNLYTGQERREIPFATHGAATVEMAVLTEEYDVIVIDEIQMLSDWERGFAWTRALLGSRCKEIHVCGGLEAAAMVQRMVEACGDQFELLTYRRFSELQIASRSLSDVPDQLDSYRHVRSGDCVVAFSRNDIFAIKREIETTTPFKCCVIYGSLPPATRSEQARRFNDPDSGYDVLVASDAIGMGLNLNIRRIIFNSVYKNDGTGIVRLDHSAMKQISGRAGRRNSPFPIGEVTTRDPRDMEYLRQCLSTDIAPIEKAGLLPTTSHIQTFSDTLEQFGLGHGPKNLHNVLLQFNDMASVRSDYFVCKQGAMVKIARVIARLDLNIPDKYLLCQCPVSERDSSSMDVLKRFAAKLAAGQVAGLTRSMVPKAPKSFDDLSRLCGIFSELELFMWLQRKFPPGNVMEQQTAQSLKEQAIHMIAQGLSATDKLKLNHCYISRDRSLRQKWSYSQSKQKERYDEDEDEDWNDGVADV